MDREALNLKSREFFEGLWQKGDPWELESSDYERRRYARVVELVRDRHYGAALEIGCGAGVFTRHLADLADRVVAIDISPTAIAGARASLPQVDFRVANAMEFDVRKDGPWDLVVMAETVYYLGWLYSFFDVGWLISELYGATRPGGRMLLANTLGVESDMLTLPWLIRSYRDLFVNVGFRVEHEEIFHGRKHDVDLHVLMTLLAGG